MNVTRSPIIGLCAVMAFSGVPSLLAAQAAPPAVRHSGTPAPQLPAGAGRATFVQRCSGCHEPTIVTGFHYGKKDWSDVVQMMAVNGAKFSQADAEEIATYLAANFPARAKN